MHRISIVSLAANAAAWVLIGLTGAALAGPILPADIAGFIAGSAPVTFSHAFIDTLSPIFLSGSVSGSSSIIVTIGSSLVLPISGLLYAVYATVSTLISTSSSSLGVSGSSSLLGSGTHLIGYILGTDLSSLGPLSSVSSTADLPIYGGPYTTGYGLDSFFFVLAPGVHIPEPSGIAVIVTAVAGAAALLGRRRLRRAKD